MPRPRSQRRRRPACRHTSHSHGTAPSCSAPRSPATSWEVELTKPEPCSPRKSLAVMATRSPCRQPRCQHAAVIVASPECHRWPREDDGHDTADRGRVARGARTSLGLPRRVHPAVGQHPTDGVGGPFGRITRMTDSRMLDDADGRRPRRALLRKPGWATRLEDWIRARPRSSGIADCPASRRRPTRGRGQPEAVGCGDHAGSTRSLHGRAGGAARLERRRVLAPWSCAYVACHPSHELTPVFLQLGSPECCRSRDRNTCCTAVVVGGSQPG